MTHAPSPSPSLCTSASQSTTSAPPTYQHAPTNGTVPPPTNELINTTRLSDPGSFLIRVPASAANIGPGFDALGLALSLHLSLHIVPSHTTTITYTGSCPISLHPAENLITTTASYIASIHGTVLPPLHITVTNPIPLGRGMGSSGAAVVAGCMLANHACKLGLSKHRLMDYALVVEGHPDNVAASMFGGFTAGYMTNDRDSATPLNLGTYISIPWPSTLKAVLVIPSFELPTKLARSVLPLHYSRADVVFNLQRLAVLITTLSRYSSSTDPNVVYEAMKDTIHQPYRSHLVPGLTRILQELNPDTCPGLLGICMSGAGPCVLAITNDNHKQVGERIQSIWNSTTAPDIDKGIESEAVVLDVEPEGAVVLKL
ncbi:homoserine kinase [Synchytrium endobioticum]|uniref:Homoserine kinase n=1 Tax=Synchytrium endobioticum TaxID=286115 RepID=A0A507CI49_9FUNG|nr:homoserine kinase [Synchytrium endobioticum]TPX39188.1 homoserine kinase [Synchytrium endobioticum]